jgi:hypothetical protein
MGWEVYRSYAESHHLPLVQERLFTFWLMHKVSIQTSFMLFFGYMIVSLLVQGWHMKNCWLKLDYDSLYAAFIFMVDLWDWLQLIYGPSTLVNCGKQCHCAFHKMIWLIIMALGQDFHFNLMGNMFGHCVVLCVNNHLWLKLCPVLMIVGLRLEGLRRVLYEFHVACA